MDLLWKNTCLEVVRQCKSWFDKKLIKVEITILKNKASFSIQQSVSCRCKKTKQLYWSSTKHETKKQAHALKYF